MSRKRTISAGQHRANGFRIGLYFRQSFSWGVKFDESAVYNIGHYDQLDINKLCGIKYFGKGPNKGDYSARFGWRYNPEHPDTIEILAYVHDDGNITMIEKEIFMGRIRIGYWGDLDLKVHADHYEFIFDGITHRVPKTHNKKISYRQGLYFGGDRPAPHNITVQFR